MQRRKHRKDKNNGKNGMVSGNARYHRTRKSRLKRDVTMGRSH